MTRACDSLDPRTEARAGKVFIPFVEARVCQYECVTEEQEQFIDSLNTKQLLTHELSLSLKT